MATTQTIIKYEAANGAINCMGEDGWKIRGFVDNDLDDVCALCRDSFPLDYPIDWYKEVINGRYLSYGLFHYEVLTSLLVAEHKTIAECDPEDQTLCKDQNATVVYILSLAVSGHYRRQGLATILLNHLLSIVSNINPPPRLIYLHVLRENLPAIFFYHKNGFRHHATLPKYYVIENQFRDGFTFVRYLAPSAFGEILTSIYEAFPRCLEACSSLLEFLAVPFRRCINQSNQNRKKSLDQQDKLVRV